MPTPLGSALFLYQPQHSLTPVTAVFSPVSCVYRFSPPPFPPSHHIFFHGRGIRSCGVSHSIPLCPHSFTCKRSLQWVLSLVQGLWLLLHQYWTLSEPPLCSPAAAPLVEILRLWKHESTGGAAPWQKLQTVQEMNLNPMASILYEFTL